MRGLFGSEKMGALEKGPRFRLFRSRAFWFGVPGLMFLLWAWADSMRYNLSLIHI